MSTPSSQLGAETTVLIPGDSPGFPPLTMGPGRIAPGSRGGKGRGGEGSLASSLLLVGNLDRANGTLFSSGFPSTKAYLGRDPGGEGSCDTGTWTDVGIGAGRATASATRSASTGAKIVAFMAMLCGVSGQDLGTSGRL